MPHPETRNFGPSSMSGLVLRAMGATADSVELLRSNGPSNFNKQTSLFVFLKEIINKPLKNWSAYRSDKTIRKLACHLISKTGTV